MKSIDAKFKKSLVYAMNALKASKYSKDIIGLIVYGSVARGDATSESDIDLLLILEEATFDRSGCRELKSLVNSGDLDLPEIDLQIHFGREVTNTLFYNQIKKEGIVLWKK